MLAKVSWVMIHVNHSSAMQVLVTLGPASRCKHMLLRLEGNISPRVMCPSLLCIVLCRPRNYFSSNAFHRPVFIGDSYRKLGCNRKPSQLSALKTVCHIVLAFIFLQAATWPSAGLETVLGVQLVRIRNQVSHARLEPGTFIEIVLESMWLQCRDYVYIISCTIKADHFWYSGQP